jgi:hypothetical protein
MRDLCLNQYIDLYLVSVYLYMQDQQVCSTDNIQETHKKKRRPLKNNLPKRLNLMLYCYKALFHQAENLYKNMCNLKKVRILQEKLLQWDKLLV